MSGKIKLIILAVLLVVSFVTAFFVTRMFSPPKPKPPGPEVAKKVPEGALQGEERGLVSPDDKQVADLVKELRIKIEMYQQKLQDLEKREKQIQAAQKELKKQSDELAQLQAELKAPVSNLKAQIDELRKTQVVIKQDQRDNLTQIAAVYVKMAPAEASQVLETMCKNRQDEDAARIMYFVSLQSDRQAGKIWDAFTNKDLAAKLMEMMKRIHDDGKPTSEGGA
ncbi:MAG: hypothetical protein HZA50_06305 [Planctomycetes bacterium]|nr:hypothetical protein [Planctomycetota bacterium]